MWQVKCRGTTAANIFFLIYVFSGWHWWLLLFPFLTFAVNTIWNRSSLANNRRFGLNLKKNIPWEILLDILYTLAVSLLISFFIFFFSPLQLRYLTMMSSLCQTTRLKVVSTVWLIAWICLCFLLLFFLWAWSPLPASVLGSVSVPFQLTIRR